MSLFVFIRRDIKYCSPNLGNKINQNDNHGQYISVKLKYGRTKHGDLLTAFSHPLSLPGGPLQAERPDDFRHPAFLLAVRGGFEPPVRLPVRQFSKLVVSATHPSHQADPFSNGTANIRRFYCFAIFSRISVSACMFFIL